MKIFICSSKHFYPKISGIVKELEEKGNKITLPNSFENPLKEEEMKKIGEKEHIKWKADKLRLQNKKVSENDAILVCNFDKDGKKNYIGGATFLEIFKAWETKKKIFLLNPIPKCSFTDELIAMEPRIINGNLSLLK